MSNNDFIKEKVISNFISLNPTGVITLSDNGSFKMSGVPSKIMTPSQSAKQNLNEANSNKFVCNQTEQKIEKFENYNIEKIKKNKSNKNIYLVIGLFLVLLIGILFIYKKRK